MNLMSIASTVQPKTYSPDTRTKWIPKEKIGVVALAIIGAIGLLAALLANRGVPLFNSLGTTPQIILFATGGSLEGGAFLLIVLGNCRKQAVLKLDYSWEHASLYCQLLEPDKDLDKWKNTTLLYPDGFQVELDLSHARARQKNNKPTIRAEEVTSLTRAEWEEVCDIEREAFVFGELPKTCWGGFDRSSCINTLRPLKKIVARDEKDKIVGILFHTNEDNRAHIYTFSRRATHGRLGIGTTLLDRFFENVVSQKSYKGASLRVRASNFSAQQLYESKGFKTTLRCTNYYAYTASPEDGYFMVYKKP
ncbi:MAG: hypothetical protein K940chlam9_00040 [Chlamydiae bacterium]|nr:hypothetical protein [Chlamydiota bacterium]